MKNLTQLKQWIFNKPCIFTLIFFAVSTILTLAYSLIQTFLNFESVWPIYLIFGISFAFSTYYMIKKLPHDEMYHKDFVAIINATYIVSIVSSIVAIFMLALFGQHIQEQVRMMYFMHPILFTVIFVGVSLISLYLFGLALVGFYAKYKRATTMGISPWRVILSMPFAFLLMWMPGYLIQEKGKKSNLLIKSKWYGNFTDWTVSNFSNLAFVFLFLMLYKCAISGLSTTILTCALIVIYTIWYIKHKKDFVKNINGGYALSAIAINLAILIAVILNIG